VTAEAEKLNRTSPTDVITVYKAEPPPTSSPRASKPRKPTTGSGGGAGGGGGGGAEYSRIYSGRSVGGTGTLSPEEQKRAHLQATFHPTVLAVVDRLKDKKLSPSPDEGKFIRNGKAEIQIWLTEKSDETVAKLKELGFEVLLDPKTAKLVIGRLPIEKLAALAELKSVRYVAPQFQSN
jgi:hypothetical protein